MTRQIIKLLLLSAIMGCTSFMAKGDESVRIRVLSEALGTTENFKQWEEGDTLRVQTFVTEFVFHNAGFAILTKEFEFIDDKDIFPTGFTDDFDKYTATVDPEGAIWFHSETNDIDVALLKYGEIYIQHNDPFWNGLTEILSPTEDEYELNLEAVKDIGVELYKLRKISRTDYNIIKSWE